LVEMSLPKSSARIGAMMEKSAQVCLGRHCNLYP
jgi:hypothetical protein